jgi:hypothetical protein
MQNEPSYDDFDRIFEESKKAAEREPLKIQSVDQLPNEFPPVIIDGLLRKREILLMGGKAKRQKSWARLDLLYCVANGMPWLGLETTRSKVIHLDFESHSASLRNRFELIRDSYGKGDFANLYVVTLRERDDYFMAGDIEGLSVELADLRPELFSLDPIYQLLGGKNESDPGVVTQLLRSFLRLGLSLEMAICLIQHFTKGDASEKESQDRFSGTAVWSRFPDALVTFTDNEDEDCFGVEFTLRDFAPLQSRGVRWKFPRFHCDSSVDPERLKKPQGGRPKLNTAEQLAGLIHGDEEISYTDLLRRAQKICGMKKVTFDRRLREAKQQGLIYLSPLNGLYALTSNYVSKNQNQSAA